jgi:hypothetical protein
VVSRFQQAGRFLFFSGALLILPLLAPASNPARADEPSQDAARLEAPRPQETVRPQDAAKEVLAKYLASRPAAMPLRSVSMDTAIEGAVPKMKKKGIMQAVRKIDGNGVISYEKFQFEGDDMVKKDVIVRYLNAEQETRSQNVDIGIHERNYKFSYKARLVLGDRPIFVFKVEPRRKAVGLFKGEIWLDGETGMITREAGRLVKNPSIFFKKTDFQRRYELADGQPRIAEMSTQIETRLVGRVEMQIKYSNYARLEPGPAQAPAEPGSLARLTQ